MLGKLPGMEEIHKLSSIVKDGLAMTYQIHDLLQQIHAELVALNDANAEDSNSVSMAYQKLLAERQEFKSK